MPPADDPPRSRVRSIKILAAALLFLPAFIPFGAIEGYTDELRNGMGVVKQWLLGIAILGTLSILTSASLPARLFEFPKRLLERLIAGPTWRFLSIYLTIIFLVLCTISTVVFKNRPMNIDAIVQLFQAKSFAQGHLFAPPPALPEFFITLNNLFEPNGWYSQYPPGHIALLAIGVLIGSPWLVMVVCSVLTALFLFLFVREAYSERTARLSLVLLVLTPFYLFMGASYMNHVSAALFISIALYYFAKWESSQKSHLLGLCGANLGIAFLSRPLCAMTAGAVLGLCFLPHLLSTEHRGKAVLSAVIGATGFGIFGIILLFYNYSTTGDPFLPGYLKLWGEGHGLGFHETPFGKMHTPFQGLYNQLMDISKLSEYLFEWPIPSMLPVALALVLGLLSKKWDHRLLALMLAYPCVYFFYWHRDTFLGPRFLYISILSMVPLTVRALECLFDLVKDKAVRIFPSQPALPIKRILIVALSSCILFEATIGFPFRFEIYNGGLNSLKKDLIGEARAKGIQSGLILVPVAWGSRIIAKLRALGVPAHTVEKTYRSSDHCELDRIAKEARSKGMTAGDIEQELIALRGEKVEKYKLNGDPTLRLSPNRRLSAECWDEVNYDALGYGLFMPFLADNTPDLKGPFVVATDLRDLNKRLIERYPELPVYLYRGGEFVAAR